MDKKFRFTVVAILVFAVFMINSQNKKEGFFKDPAVCDGFNTFGAAFFGDADACLEKGCFLERAEVIGLGGGKCVSCVPDDKKTEEPKGCCSGKADQTSGEGLSPFKDKYRCESESDPINSAEREVASFIQDMGLFEDDSKLAYYATIFGGGILLFMMIAVIL